MYEQSMFWDTSDAISSPESPGGNSPSNSPGGRKGSRSGRQASRASRSLRPASGEEATTTDTCGPCSPPSSASVALTESLGSRLRALTESLGSMEYAQTWKSKATPAGLPYWAHTASARRTSGNESTGWLNGWPTPQACEAPNMSAMREDGREAARTTPQNVPALVGWPTPKAQEDGRTLQQYEKSRLKGYETRKGLTSGGPASKQGGLAIASQLTGWNTPRATDGSKGGPNQSGGALPHDASLAGWATPRASDLGRCRSAEALARAREHGGSVSLEDQVHLARTVGAAALDSLPKACTAGTAEALEVASMPMDRPMAGAMETPSENEGDCPRQMNPGPGTITPSSPASTASRGVLNAAFSRWLMGFPLRHDHCSPHWRDWDTIQGLLAACGGSGSSFWRALAETVSDGSEATGTRSFLR